MVALVFAVFIASGAALLSVTIFVWQGRTGSASGSVGMPAPGQSPSLHPTVTVTQHSSDLHQLLIAAAIGLAIMATLTLGLSWVIADRLLRPLRKITATTKVISATNLHERLNLTGPDDELKELADTFDELLARLERSFEFERQFVANASHELRTPLAGMRTSLEVTMAKPGPVPPQFHTLAERLGRELDHADRLLESFLTLAHTQQGPIDDQATLALDALARRALQRRAGAISAAGLSVEQRLHPDALVTGSETLLSRMVENVVDNAINHNQRGGWVQLTIISEGQLARLVVENGGPIIEPEAVKQLAQPFRRIGAQRTGSDKGAGLGLAIIAAITQVHGGTLDLQARTEGGLRVAITLPLTVRTPAGAVA
jgi:hypothetical protein